jgi:hypothetical protein
VKPLSVPRASADAARRAAEEVALYENRLASLETKVTVLTWMVGFNLAMTAAVLWKVFTPPG